ncbi:MAG: NYN domain-containing protein [Nitrospiraceae bacterium]|nr:NYN domain-containing protein [Nitrospiraceae bacterium]
MNSSKTGARLLIDGYNLIGIQHANLEKKRGELVGLLQAYRNNTGNEVTVVFDGWKNSASHLESRTVTGGIKVVYSRLGEKADSVIKKILEKETGIILVSSDRELQNWAWSRGSVAVSSELFETKLLSGREKGPEKQDEYEEDEDDFSSQSRKTGNPRQPSKRQKALERALKRL